MISDGVNTDSGLIIRWVMAIGHNGWRTPASGTGKNRWHDMTGLSCRSFAASAVLLQLHAPAHNLANFVRTLALPNMLERRSPTSFREKLAKIGAKIVRHARYVTSQMTELAIPRELFHEILRLADVLRRSVPIAA